MNAGLKHIVFDLGAVLFAWQPRQMLMREVPHLAPDENSAAHWVQEIFQSYGGDWGEFDRGTVTVPQLVQRIAHRTGLAQTDVLRVVDAVPRELQPMPDTVALLHRLGDAGHRLFYLSNMPLPYAHILHTTNPFFSRFHDGVFSCHVQHNKPEAAIFKLAAARFGSAPQQLVFMDDQALNVEAARALGWCALQFHNAAQASAGLRAQGWISKLV